MSLNELTHLIIGKAIEIHKALGPGLLESTYQACLFYELEQAGLFVEKEKSLSLVYKEIKLDQGYKIDLLVENKVVIELKCVEKLAPVHTAQTITYIKLGDYKIGLLINFYSKVLKDGIRRYIN